MLVKSIIIIFILLETSNVLALYFAPSSKYANSVGVFSAWEESKQYPEIHDFIKYLVNWVAGVKLIFLLLMGIIVMYADIEIQRLSLLALAVATATFYWRLFPLSRKIDRYGKIQPQNYSVILGGMIFAFIGMFLFGYFA